MTPTVSLAVRSTQSTPPPSRSRRSRSRRVIRHRRRSLTGALATLTVLPLFALAPAPAAAATSGPSMPWDTGLANVVNNLTGPTAYFFVLAAIVITGLYWAFTRHSEGGNRLAQIIFGAAIALGAVALLAALGISATVV